MKKKTRKEWKDHQITEGRANMNKFFMGVRKERSATPSVDTSSVTATNTENPSSNNVRPPTFTSTATTAQSKNASQMHQP